PGAVKVNRRKKVTGFGALLSTDTSAVAPQVQPRPLIASGGLKVFSPPLALWPTLRMSPFAPFGTSAANVEPHQKETPGTHKRHVATTSKTGRGGRGRGMLSILSE